MMNEDGSYNIIRKGGLNGISDIYKFLIEIHWIYFVLILVGGFIAINLIFALTYLAIGIEHINGVNPDIPHFLNAFFFSSQTFTTVGYGALSPGGVATNVVAMFESFLGLTSFAIATGLLWGRFSRPALKIAFSKNIIITPFEGGMAVMFKMVNQRNNVLLNTKVRCLFTIDKETVHGSYNKVYSELKLETEFVNFFPLTWTLVHKMNEDSPIFGLDFNTLKARHAEVIILVETFDETYSQTILQKHSYSAQQWLEKVKFARNFEANERGQIELNIRDLDRVSPIN